MPGYGRLLDPGSSRAPWLAEITGLHPTYRFTRQFLRGQKDYTHANGIGSRGVILHFIVDEGPIYEINYHTSWKSSRRYFFRVQDGVEIEMTEEEARQCLSTRRD